MHLQSSSHDTFQAPSFHVSGSGFWWSGFEEYLAQEKNVTDWRDSFESGKLSLYLSDFFFSAEGAKDRVKLAFESELECNEGIPPIIAAEMGSITYRQERYT